MQQRVAIAQALIMKPPILLMDEAFSALDPGTRAGMQRLIKELWRESGTTIVFVTHNTREAVCLATRVIALGRTRSGGGGANIVLDLSVSDTNDEVEDRRYDPASGTDYLPERRRGERRTNRRPRSLN